MNDDRPATRRGGKERIGHVGSDWLPMSVDPDLVPADVDSLMGVSQPSADPAGADAGRVRLRGRARARYLRDQVWLGVSSQWDVLAVIAVGGAIGSLGRWGLTQVFPHASDGFPWATFLANVSGCFLLGLLMVFVLDVWLPNRYVRPFAGVGLLGGYTTFSTYMLDARGLLVGGHAGLAGVYLLASWAAGLAAVWLALTGARVALAVGRRRLQRRADREQAPAGAGRPPSRGG
jgi:fluoride exporter